MRVELYGLAFETPAVTFCLWSPWRATYLEHRLFDVLRQLPGVNVEKDAEELRVHVSDAKTWKNAIQAVARVLKGWQEEAESGGERRGWRWMVEADVDFHGYDHAGERSSLWAFLRLSLDRGNPGEEQKGEDIDLNDFGLRIWPQDESD
jgi:hypothetical protein